MTHYEVVKVGTEWCLRIRATGQPVAWSKNDDKPWRDYCAEVEADTESWLRLSA